MKELNDEFLLTRPRRALNFIKTIKEEELDEKIILSYGQRI